MFRLKQFSGLTGLETWFNSVDSESIHLITVIPHGVTLVAVYVEDTTNVAFEPVTSVANVDVTDPTNNAVPHAGSVQHPLTEALGDPRTSMVDRAETPVHLRPNYEPPTTEDITEALRQTSGLEGDKGDWTSVGMDIHGFPVAKGSAEDVTSHPKPGPQLIVNGVPQTTSFETADHITAGLPVVDTLPSSASVVGTVPGDIPAQPNSIELVPQGIGEYAASTQQSPVTLGEVEQQPAGEIAVETDPTKAPATETFGDGTAIPVVPEGVREAKQGGDK